MEPRSLQYMTVASQGQRLIGASDTLLLGVSTDSRNLRRGDLFVPLRGDRFDGHRFVDDAARSGAAAVLMELSSLPPILPACAVIAVDDTRAAFGRIAAAYRREFTLPLVAVAGSNGKTTTKDILATVLSRKFKTLSSPASFNNDIGVPTTLLRLDHTHEVAVLEFGTNHPGELAPLLRMAGPQIGVLTSIGREHLEFFGDLTGVVDEEGWLAELLASDGKLFINGDAPGVEEISRRSHAPVVRVGLEQHNPWRAANVRLDATSTTFDVLADQPEFCREFRIPLLGRHQALNALLAVAVAAEFGLTPGEIQDGLMACAPAEMRLQSWTFQGARILDDSYNANADSMRAALETLRDLPCQGRRLAVLGTMAELGRQSGPAHLEIGRCAAASNLDYLLTVGNAAKLIGQGARDAGFQNVIEFSDVTLASQALESLIRAGDLVLLKASRVAGLDRIRELLESPSSPATDIGQCQIPPTPKS